MGEIKTTVPLDRLSTRIENILSAFTHVASITWYRECLKKGTTLHAFLVKLDRAVAEAGYEEEMLLVYCPYPTLEPRSLRIIDELFADPELAGRVESYAFFWFQTLRTCTGNSRRSVAITLRIGPPLSS